MAGDGEDRWENILAKASHRPVILLNKHILLAYVDGCDLHDVAPLLRNRFQEFISRHLWSADEVMFVDQVRHDDPSLGLEDLPDWELGLNIGLAYLSQNRTGFSADFAAVIAFLQHLHQESGRDFVLEVGSRETGFSHNITFVDAKPINVPALEAIVERYATHP